MPFARAIVSAGTSAGLDRRQFRPDYIQSPRQRADGVLCHLRQPHQRSFVKSLITSG